MDVWENLETGFLDILKPGYGYQSMDVWENLEIGFFTY